VIEPKRINCVDISVRDLPAALEWYRRHFGFEKLYEVSGDGWVVGNGGVEIALFEARADDPAKAVNGYTGTEVAIRMFGLEVDEADFARLNEEFAADDDLVWIDHPRYKSCITEDPDGNAIELIVPTST
jgi:catechol 2,3-dioxygenase-like lactoylglutathione lyase family enzyme